MNVIVSFFMTLLLGSIGFFFGRRAERKHFARIEQLEAELKHIMVVNERHVPPQYRVQEARLVCGSVVIAEDYFKRLVAGVKNFFGGRLTTYESLLDRARREAVIRMKLDAQKMGAKVIFNARLETSSLSENVPNALFCAEVYAYGTALK
jgi:uncharacterized protein YbjQ (UPF0145 family)